MGQKLRSGWPKTLEMIFKDFLEKIISGQYYLSLGLGLGDKVSSDLDLGLEEGLGEGSDRHTEQVAGLLGNWGRLWRG